MSDEIERKMNDINKRRWNDQIRWCMRFSFLSFVSLRPLLFFVLRHKHTQKDQSADDEFPLENARSSELKRFRLRQCHEWNEKNVRQNAHATNVRA